MAVNAISKNIQEMRKQKGVTQEELAKTVGVTAQAVSKWEGGGTPDVELLVPIADYFGVSIDRLFGRNINEYGNIESEVAKLISGVGKDNSISKAFELCWAIQKGISGRSAIEPKDNLNAILERNTGYVYSRMLLDNGVTHMALNKELQYFILMPEPEEGWLKELGDKEAYLELFKMLSDPDILSALYLLYSRDNKPFTPKLLEKGLGISSQESVKILDKLAVRSLIRTSEIELDDEVQKVYNFRPSPSFIAVLSICKELIRKPDHFCFYRESRSKPYLRNVD